MRVGLLYGPGLGSCSGEILAQVEEADRVGLDSVLFEERRGGRGCPGPMVAAAAARTTAIRVGTADRVLALEHPVHTAEDFAVVDVMSRGRVILGVSPGEDPGALRAAGVEWEGREQRFREAVDLVRAAWTQDSFQFVGEHVSFPLGAQGPPGWRREPFTTPYLEQWRRGQVVPQHLPVLPKPVQMPHPPILVAAREKATIEWAARRGLGLLCSSLDTEDELGRALGWYADALAAAGRDRCEVDVAVAREVFLADDGATARELALPSLRRFLEAERAGARPADDRAALDLDEADLLERCFLVGSPLEVLDRLKRLQANLGMTHLVGRVHLPGRPHLDVVGCIRLMASAIQTRLVA
ncbi:MAG: LLM class flavin-dependent oxidoreductase [Acidimicrobiia bacterium]|nr:LLM class flavin-dependent oxidoreductase [Acidimicrobiia bacterium]